MLCFTSPTVKMFCPFLDTARKMAFWISLVSWYSSTRISRYRAATCSPALWGHRRNPPAGPGPSAPGRRSRQRSAAASPAGTAPAKSSVSSSRATMAGATAVRSSIASSSETDNRPASFFSSALHRSHTCFQRGNARLVLPPPGGGKPGKATAASVCRAASQVWTWARASKATDTWRNFSPYPRYSASSPRSGRRRTGAGPPVGPFRRMEASSSAAGGCHQSRPPSRSKRSGSPPATRPGPRGSGPCRTAPAPGRPDGCRPVRPPACPPAGRGPRPAGHRSPPASGRAPAGGSAGPRYRPAPGSLGSGPGCPPPGPGGGCSPAAATCRRRPRS